MPSNRFRMGADGTSMYFDGNLMTRQSPGYNEFINGRIGQGQGGANPAYWNEIQGPQDDSGRSNSTYELNPEWQQRLGNRTRVPQVGIGGYAEGQDPSLIEWDEDFGLVSRPRADGSSNVSAANDMRHGLTYYLPYALAAAFGGATALGAGGFGAAGADAAAGSAAGGEAAGGKGGSGNLFEAADMIDAVPGGTYSGPPMPDGMPDFGPGPEGWTPPDGPPSGSPGSGGNLFDAADAIDSVPGGTYSGPAAPGYFEGLLDAAIKDPLGAGIRLLGMGQTVGGLLGDGGGGGGGGGGSGGSKGGGGASGPPLQRDPYQANPFTTQQLANYRPIVPRGR